MVLVSGTMDIRQPIYALTRRIHRDRVRAGRRTARLRNSETAWIDELVLARTSRRIAVNRRHQLIVRGTQPGNRTEIRHAILIAILVLGDVVGLDARLAFGRSHL